MRSFRSLASVLVLSGLTTCATLVSGTSQRVSVETEPEGAACSVLQGGMPVGFVASTPGVVRVDKSSSALEIRCTKPGYGDAQQMQASGVTAWVAGNLVIGGLVGLVIDFASGAAYHYGSNMTLAMQAGPGSFPLAAGLPTEVTGAPATAIAMAPAQPGPDGLRQVQAYNAARFRAATGSDLPAQHGLIRLPPATPDGDYTYIWPTPSSTD